MSVTQHDEEPFTFLDSAAQAHLTCAICMFPLREARRACSEDHYFCTPCIADLTRSISRSRDPDDASVPKCPTCRRTMTVHEDGEFGKPAAFIDDVVACTWTKCTHPQCNAKFTLKDAKLHADEVCGEVELECDVPGCDAKFKRKDWATHFKKFATEHLRLQCIASIAKTDNLQKVVHMMHSDLNFMYTQLGSFQCCKMQLLEAKVDKMTYAMQRMCEGTRRIVDALEASTKGSPPGLGWDRLDWDRAKTGLKRKLVDVDKDSNKKKAVTIATDDASWRLPPLPSFERASGAGPSSYAPPSPEYSPTSPTYSPTSPQYSPPAAEEEVDEE